MSQSPYEERPPGRPSGGSGARGVVLLAVAVGLGILVLQAFDTGSSPYSRRVTTATTTPSETGDQTTLPAGEATTTTPAARAPADVKVLVANGTGSKGFGSRTANALKALGYNILAPVDTTRSLDSTSVQYADGFEAEAQAVARSVQLPASAVQRLNSPPVPAVRDANVVVLLGADSAPTSTTAKKATTATTSRSSTATTTRNSTTTTRRTTTTTR